MQCKSIKGRKATRFTPCYLHVMWVHLVCWGDNSVEYRHEYFLFLHSLPLTKPCNILFPAHNGTFKASISDLIEGYPPFLLRRKLEWGGHKVWSFPFLFTRVLEWMGWGWRYLDFCVQALCNFLVIHLLLLSLLAFLGQWQGGEGGS